MICGYRFTTLTRLLPSNGLAVIIDRCRVVRIYGFFIAVAYNLLIPCIFVQ